jgi:P pilus assembly chaperone PapD
MILTAYPLTLRARIAAAGALLGMAASAAAAAQTAPSAQPEAQAQPAPQAVNVNLNITPKRLVLDRGNRTGTVYIFNQGNVPATFDVALIQRVMLNNGEIRAVAEAGTDAALQPVVGRLKSAQEFVRATPRRVTLAPGKGQTVRIRADPPPGTAPGEYRTHLTVTTIPPRDAGVTAEQASSQRGDQLSFRITSVFGLSIPVIIRNGAVEAQGRIENARFDRAMLSPDGVSPPVQTAVLRFDLRRTGTSSLFGNVEVRSKSGRESLGLQRGIGVYPEIDHRSIQIPLRRTPKKGEALEITFTDEDSGARQVIARATVTAS